jgi:hypothetical protein
LRPGELLFLGIGKRYHAERRIAFDLNDLGAKKGGALRRGSGDSRGWEAP